MKVLVADVPQRRQLGALPDGVELTFAPASDVEVVVLGVELMGNLTELFATLERVRVVLSVFAGVDGFIARVPEGVVVCSASGAHDIAVSEWIVAALLALRRRLPELLESQADRRWDRDPYLDVDDLDGATVLVLGHGSIGRAVGARLAPFGANVVGVARHARVDAHGPQELERLLPDADAVVVLLALTAETERIVDAAFLARMKPGAILINASRGRHVDNDALLEALHAGRIRAALDVTDPEPLPPDHPLWRAPGVLITPHIAGAVRHWQARAYRLAGDQIRRYAAGEPLLNVRSGVQSATAD